ncbi:MAG: 2OG-Fe(II) oxygenase [Bdellovibrionaceae bacterium]|nr:2OG-Fe(II) oxygenase [Pseudobdellovibrionaceae bacterium]
MNSLTLDQLEHLEQNGWVFLQIPEIWQDLLSQAQALQGKNQFKPAEIKTSLSTDQSQLIRNDLIHWVKDDTSIDAEKLFNQQINYMMYQIKDYFRVGLDHFEAHYALYPPNHFYQRHSDQKKENNKRQFSFVYYLNPKWKAEYGGELVGYHGDTSEREFGVFPNGGTLALFKSDIEHEVCISNSARFSITGWMRTR